jgi:hypothetical protein
MPPSKTFTKSSLFAISYLLLAVLFLQLGAGLQGILVPIRAQMEGFSFPSIGLSMKFETFYQAHEIGLDNFSGVS